MTAFATQGVGNLTRDPELRQSSGGLAICKLRLAYNTRQKDAGGEWGEKSNYVDVTIFGKQAENAAEYLAKGRKVFIIGTLEYQEWTDKETGKTRSAHAIIANEVEYLTPRGDTETASVRDERPAVEPDEDLGF